VRGELFPTREAYPFNLRVLQATRSLHLRSKVTFFIGENGSGKSTLLRAIARSCGIHIWEGLERARFTPNPFEGELHRYLEAEWAGGPVPGSFFSSDLFRGFSQSVDEWAINDPEVLKVYGGKSLLVQSHGQSHMAFFTNRFRIPGLHFLDEPENALSPRTQLRLRDLLTELALIGQSQFILASHSPILLSTPGATIVDFDGESLEPIEYRQTDHFRTYRDFFAQMGE